MCFSATASFVASGGLAVAGAATLQVAPKRRRLLAVIPFAFALQQALEGIQWLYLNDSTVCITYGYGYFAFAYIFWPVFIPAAVYALDHKSRAIMRWFLMLGIGVALWNLYFLFVGQLAVFVDGGRIIYDVGAPAAGVIAPLYIIAVCGALLVSRIRAFRLFGMLILAAAATAYIWFRPGFPSAWCYFAAVISVLVFWYAKWGRR
jgi:hypothetical protein